MLSVCIPDYHNAIHDDAGEDLDTTKAQSQPTLLYTNDIRIAMHSPLIVIEACVHDTNPDGENHFEALLLMVAILRRPHTSEHILYLRQLHGCNSNHLDLFSVETSSLRRLRRAQSQH